MKKPKVQFLDPYLTDTDIRAAVRVLKSGWITYGPVTEQFESLLSDYVGVKHAVFNSSGTAALHVALLAAGVGPGDEVITTPLSYQATANAILYVGAKPVFVDVEPDTGLISIPAVKRAVTKRTKAVIPVHLYGQMADMKSLAALAKQHAFVIIEDSAHAIESMRDGIKPGQKSFASCLSFHAAKNITCGEGGAVVCDDAERAEHMRLLCEGGVKRGGGKRWQVLLGYKYSGTQFQAALLIEQLKRIEKQWRKRKILWERYAAGLSGVSGITFPTIVPKSRSAYHMFVVWVDPLRRDTLRKELEARGIQTSVHFNPIHLEPYWQEKFGYGPGTHPVAERLGLGVISLPLHLKLTSVQQQFVIHSLRSLL